MPAPSFSHPALRAVVLSLSLLLAPREVAAEINMADSVEWMTADADLVVRGVIQGVTRVRGKNNRLGYLRVELKVLETIKGKPRRRVRFILLSWVAKSASAWAAQKTELLVYLVKSQRRLKDDRRYGVEAFAPRRGHDVIASIVALSGRKKGQLFTMSFQQVTRRAQILQCANLAARIKGSRGVHKVDLPYNTPAYRALYGGSSVWFYVPIDRRLELLGHTWVRSRSVNRRVEGVMALAHFKSPGNIRLVRGLLADPGFWTRTSGKPGARRTRVYAVRNVAYKTLLKWKIPVKRPVIRVALP